MPSGLQQKTGHVTVSRWLHHCSTKFCNQSSSVRSSSVHGCNAQQRKAASSAITSRNYPGPLLSGQGAEYDPPLAATSHRGALTTSPLATLNRWCRMRACILKPGLWKVSARQAHQSAVFRRLKHVLAHACTPALPAIMVDQRCARCLLQQSTCPAAPLVLYVQHSTQQRRAPVMTANTSCSSCRWYAW